MRYIYIIVAILTFTSCVEEISLDPKERVVVVECVLEKAPSQIVNLNYSMYVSEEEQTPISGALVNIIEYEQLSKLVDDEVIYYYPRNGRKIETTEKKAGVYEAAFYPLQYAKYELEAFTPGGDTITATTIYDIDTNVFRWDHRYYGGTTTIHDPYGHIINIPSTTIKNINYALFPSFRILTDATIPDSYFWVYGMDYDPATNKYVQTDLITVPYPDSIKLLASTSVYHEYYSWIDEFNMVDVTREEVEEFKHPDNVEVSIPEVFEYGFPQYIHSKYKGASNPMYYKYLRLKRNINKVGYDKDMKEHGYLLGACWPNEFCQNMYIAANFKQYKYGIPHPKAYLAFMLANEDYEKYLRSALIYEMKRFNDLTDIWSTENRVYSNINNGLGIFGARYIKKVPYQDYEYIEYNGVKFNKKYSVE